jgi:hypothetical protein
LERKSLLNPQIIATNPQIIATNPEILVLNQKVLALNQKVLALNPKVFVIYPRVDTHTYKSTPRQEQSHDIFITYSHTELETLTTVRRWEYG